jgi:hypothetical protein
MNPDSTSPVTPPTPPTEVNFLTPMVVAAIHGIEVAKAYQTAGLTWQEALWVMVQLTRPTLCVKCGCHVTNT